MDPAITTAVAAALLLGIVLGVLLGAPLGGLRARAGWASERARLVAAVETERTLGAERLAAATGTTDRLEERFGVLSAEALRQSATQFLDLAEHRLDAKLTTGSAALDEVVIPLRDSLGKVASQLDDNDRRGAAAAAALIREMELVRTSSEQLRDQTGALINTLRTPQGGGRWGEMQLRRVVEIAGMVERCDFDVQVSASTASGPVRPDLVVRLAGGRNVVVDAKVSLSAFLSAAETTDEEVRGQRLASHARHLRAHVDALAAKEYWSAFRQSPEFIVLFIPGDAFLSAALEVDPALLEHAFRRRVHPLTPATLISALRTIALEWQQVTLTDNARAVYDVGRELYQRLSIYAGHVDRLGRTLGSAVSHYNAAVGSLERNVLASGRRLHDLGVTGDPIRQTVPLTEPVRRVSAPELRPDEECEVALVGPAATRDGAGNSDIGAS